MIKQRAYIESKTEEMMETAFEEIEDQARQYQIPIIQFLVFFTGLLAVVIVASDIVFTVESLDSAIRLLLVMMGGLLISFGSFSLLLPETPTMRTSAMIGIGFILLIIVIIISI